MASTPRIAVVGSANIDLITFANAFPRPGETVFGRNFELGFGGKGANQAVAARLGSGGLDGCEVGADLFGEARSANFDLVASIRRTSRLSGVSSGVAPIFVEPSAARTASSSSRAPMTG